MNPKAIFFGICCLFILSITSGCSLLVLPTDQHDLGARHSSRYQANPAIDHSNYQNYQTSVAALIARENAKARQIPAGSDGATVLDLIKPTEWRSSDFANCAASDKVGVLLIHGLTDSPFLMRDIGEHFKDRHCTLTRSLLLPGHGTQPGHLLEVTKEEWEQTTQFGVASFAGLVNDLYIAGFSTGGGLAINYVLEHQADPASQIKGILLFSPAIELSAGIAAVAANWHKAYSWAYEKGKWIDLAPDEDFAKYESFAKNAGDQVHLVTKKRKRLGRKLDIPVFIAISADDSTIDPSGTIAFFNEDLTDNAEQTSKLLIYKRKDVDDVASQALCGQVSVECLASDDQEGIASYAHTAIPVASDNFHYGQAGKYASCVHYIKDTKDSKSAEDYKTCKSSHGDVVYAETFGKKAKGHDRITDKVYRRLTFNPDFSHMMELADRFILDNR